MPAPLLGFVDIIDIIAEHGEYCGNMGTCVAMCCPHDQWNIALTQCQAMLVAPHHLLLWRFGAQSQWFTVFHGTSEGCRSCRFYPHNLSFN